jgi:hypothetical protein
MTAKIPGLLPGIFYAAVWHREPHEVPVSNETGVPAGEMKPRAHPPELVPKRKALDRLSSKSARSAPAQHRCGLDAPCSALSSPWQKDQSISPE